MGNLLSGHSPIGAKRYIRVFLVVGVVIVSFVIK
jgi:hypothetical protein